MSMACGINGHKDDTQKAVQKKGGLNLVLCNVALRHVFWGHMLCILKKEYTEKSMLYMLSSTEKYPNGESKREFLFKVF